MVWKAEKGALKEWLCKVLIKIGALKFGTFTLPSGALSPYYINLRIVPSFPEVFQKICSIYQRLVEEEIGLASFERIGGIPLSALPLASCLSFTLRKPLVLIRREGEEHGRERRVEGILMPGDRVLPVDDVITTGRSLSYAVKALRHEGAVVEEAVVLVDREEGGVRRLKEEGVRVHSLMTITEAAETLHNFDIITEEEYEAILLRTKK
ncbi:orotate phosphoribosyltransferase [Candidatus Bathyarchaeota archaeon]|nr:MAG: orotate phosphoribosyltransferase [Candidatus Bathyarchaeota archaeon]